MKEGKKEKINNPSVLLSLRGVTLSRKGQRILNGIHLDIYPGEIHSLLGMNGTGKTTLAYMLMGIPEYQLDQGEILWQGERIHEQSVSERAKLGITLAWQEPARFEGLSVEEYLRIGAQGKDPFLTPAQCLESVGLNPSVYLHRAVDQTLSGGERKRIELAAVLMMRPKLAILDEPDSGIDALSIDYIKTVIRKLVSLGSTILLISHHEEVAGIADRASVLCGGQILKTGIPEEVARFFQNHCQECPHVNHPQEEHIVRG